MQYFILLAFIIAQLSAESVHWQWRDLVCTTENGKGSDKISDKPAECRMTLRESGVDNDPSDKQRSVPGNGCFQEEVNGTTRDYCNLLCPNADTVYLISRNPQTHRSCFAFHSYKFEKRGSDWYLWRDKKCRRSAITFKIRCEFLFGRKEFPADEEIFKKIART